MSRRHVIAAALLTAAPAVMLAVAWGAPRASADAPPVQGTPHRPAAALLAQSPVFASVPRFETAAAARRVGLGAPQSNSTACRPGPERVQTLPGGGRAVSLDLHLAMVQAQINNPSDPSKKVDDLVLRSYNHCLTAPMIEVFPGDTLRLTLHNDLSRDDPTCNDAASGQYLQLPGGVGCFNTTNMHFHGLHVSPSGNSDNVLLSVTPQYTQPYRVDIPRDHPAGTFWYHAHMHGSTAVHVASAVAGPLIIHGTRPYPSKNADVDTILHTEHGLPFPDTVFLFQQIAYGCFSLQNPQAPYDALLTTAGLYTTNQATGVATPGPAANAPWTCDPSQVAAPTPSPAPLTAGVVENFNSQLFSPTIWDTNGRFTSINGVVQPTITVPAGQIQRWRFVHAGIHDTINLQIIELPPNVSAASVPARLAGKSRLQQAAVLQQICPTTSGTLVPQLEIALDGLTRAKIRTINPANEKPLPIRPVARATKGAAAAIPTPVPYDSNFLQPGYRSDVLVVFRHPGTYCLIDQAAPPNERVNNGGGGAGPSVPQLLATVSVTGGQTVNEDARTYILRQLVRANTGLPSQVREGLRKGDLRPWAPFVELSPPPLGGKHRTYAHFQINDSAPQGVSPFVVNGEPYDPDSVQGVLIRQVDTTDDWDVKVQAQMAPVTPSPTPTGAPSTTPGPTPSPVLDTGEPHIFHIHVNPFEIVDIYRVTYDPHTAKPVKRQSIFKPDGSCDLSIVANDPDQLATQYCGLYHAFRDTLFIENNYDVKLRTHYARYTGEFVLHCHILDHEDAGMMANVLIVDKLGKGPNLSPHAPMRHGKPGMRM